jgi:hypothetical protein
MEATSDFDIANSSEGSKPNVEVTPIVDGVIWRVDARDLLTRVHPNWQELMLKVAERAPETRFNGGEVRTSMEAPDFETSYQPTNGLVIARELPWLFDLYRKDFRDIVAQLTGDRSVHLGTDLAHSLNMNYTAGLREGEHQGRRYELHKDRNPWTFLLGASNVEEGEGGRTLIYEDQEATRLLAALRPQEGFAVVFNGHRPHRVEEYKGRKGRLVSPGDYYNNSYPEVVDHIHNKTLGLAQSPAK